MYKIVALTAVLICFFSNVLGQKILIDTVNVEVVMVKVSHKSNYDKKDRSINQFSFIECHFFNVNDWNSKSRMNYTDIHNLAQKQHDVFYLKNDYLKNDYFFILNDILKRENIKLDFEVLSLANSWYLNLQYSVYKKKNYVFECIPMTIKSIRFIIPKGNPFFRKMVNDNFQFVMDKVAVHSIIEVRQGDRVITIDMVEN